MWLARRYALFGDLLVGGGLAVTYFITYALHCIPAICVVEREIAGVALLALYASHLAAGGIGEPSAEHDPTAGAAFVLPPFSCRR